jgi:hypothetical protein
MGTGTGTAMRRRMVRRCCRACVAFLSYMYIDGKLIRIRTCTAGCSGSASSHAREQNRELRGRHQARRDLQQHQVNLGPHCNPPRAPSVLAPTTDYLLFHAAVQRPVWEDPLNMTGGKWIKVAEGCGG